MQEPNCGFFEMTDNGPYCNYGHHVCDKYQECEFHKHGVGPEDLKGSLIGIDAGGYPIYSD